MSKNPNPNHIFFGSPFRLSSVPKYLPKGGVKVVLRDLSDMDGKLAGELKHANENPLNG